MGTGWPRLGLKMREELFHGPPRLDGRYCVGGEENWIPLSMGRAGWLAALSRGDVIPFSEPIGLWKRLLRSSSSLVSCPEALRSMASFVCPRMFRRCWKLPTVAPELVYRGSDYLGVSRGSTGLYWTILCETANKTRTRRQRRTKVV